MGNSEMFVKENKFETFELTDSNTNGSFMLAFKFYRDTYRLHDGDKPFNKDF